MKYKKKILPNGMRVVTVPMPTSLTSTVWVLTGTGSKYESKRINGISHFLEHMCFKGTEKRPTSELISGELDGLGAQYNAFTSHEYTGYFAKAEKKHFSKILDVVSDIYLHSTFPEKEIEKERGVIIGEIEMYEDTPRRHVAELFSELLYGDQPAGWNIAGTRETARSMVRDDFVEYKRSHYVAGSTAVIVAGAVDEGRVVKEVEAMFRNIPTSKKFGKKPVRDTQKKPGTLLSYKDTSQSHLVVGVRSKDIFHKDYPILQLLAAVLGGGMSSRLFRKIRDEMGAGYYVGAENESLTDHGFFTAFVGVDNSRIAEILEAIIEQFRIIRDEKVSNIELEKVKNYFVGNLFSGVETSDGMAGFYGGAEVLGKKLETPEETAEKIRAITAKDIQRVAGEIFVNRNLNLAIVGPLKSDKKLLPLLKL